MAKHIVKGYVTFQQSRYSKVPEIGFQMYKPSAEYSPDKVVVAEQEIEVEVTDNFDPRPQLVAALKEKKKLMEAQFAASVKEINDRIQSLLAIDMS